MNYRIRIQKNYYSFTSEISVDLIQNAKRLKTEEAIKISIDSVNFGMPPKYKQNKTCLIKDQIYKPQ